MLNKTLLYLSLVIIPVFITNGVTANLFYVASSSVKFRSEAPLEIISAESDKMQGIIDVSKRSFAFSVLNSSFEGFNSELQKEHFNENYMESDKFPSTVFKGKIIEDIDFSKDGTYNLRAKGFLTVHGIVDERIIKATLVVKDNELKLHSKFNVLLKDHNIRVPKVVHEKIASEILVELNATLNKEQN